MKTRTELGEKKQTNGELVRAARLESVARDVTQPGCIGVIATVARRQKNLLGSGQLEPQRVPGVPVICLLTEQQCESHAPVMVRNAKS